tara:strand:- start:235 stop:450 length:216 start_codon:yes stop_codon:yes gene_type:complete
MNVIAYIVIDKITSWQCSLTQIQPHGGLAAHKSRQNETFCHDVLYRIPFYREGCISAFLTHQKRGNHENNN